MRDGLKWARSQHITLRITWWALAFSLFHATFAAGLIFDPDTFHDSPIFSVVEDLAPLSMWSLGFFVPALFLMFAGISRRFLAWVVGMFFSTVVAMSWLICIVIARLDGAPLTLGGIGLWLWLLFTSIFITTSPRQIDVRLPAHGSQE